MEICDAHAIVLLIKLPEKGIKALGGVVDRTGVGRVEDVGLTAAWEGDVNVSLGDFSSGGAVSVHTHGSKMNDVSVYVSIKDSAAEVVRSAYVVVDSITLGLGILHGVWGCALLGEMDDRVGLLLLDEFDKQVVLLSNVEVHELDILA